MPSKNQVGILLELVRGDAVTFGLMAPSDKLIYERGSKINGVAPGVWIIKYDGKRRGVPPFLPRFSTKHTAADVELALRAAHNTFRAVSEARAASIKLSDPRYTPGVSENDDDMTDEEWVATMGPATEKEK